MHKGNDIRPKDEDLRHQLATGLGADVQRLFVFFSLYENAFVEGALPSSIKHLIGLAMAIRERASENITYHVTEALNAGASYDQIREAVTVAVLIAGVPSLLCGVEALSSMKRYEARRVISSSEPPPGGTDS